MHQAYPPIRRAAVRLARAVQCVSRGVQGVDRGPRQEMKRALTTSMRLLHREADRCHTYVVNESRTVTYQRAPHGLARTSIPLETFPSQTRSVLSSTDPVTYSSIIADGPHDSRSSCSSIILPDDDTTYQRPDDSGTAGLTSVSLHPHASTAPSCPCSPCSVHPFIRSSVPLLHASLHCSPPVSNLRKKVEPTSLLCYRPNTILTKLDIPSYRTS
jgi:hypothetical protein